MSEQVAEQVAEPVQPTALETPAEVAEGGSGNSFMEMIPEELREHPSLSPIKDVGNLARSYVNAQRLIGSDKVPLPKNPTEEDLDNIYSKLGRPETPQGYELPVDGNVITEEVAAQYADIAHNLRLTPQQAQGVLDYYKSTVQQTSEGLVEQAEKQAEKTAAELQKEWGQAFEQKVTAAKDIVEQFGGSDLLQMKLEDGTLIGNHPAFIKAFAAMGDFKSTVTSEDTVSDNATNRAYTPAMAQQEVDTIMNDKTHAYWNRKDPVGRQRAVERMQELMGYIHG
tara:strand:- start:6263 stop:7108 length:846 start_codon:yes stop_codon:yes gene_type:complete